MSRATIANKLSIKPTAFPKFTQLPAELRVQIWAYAFDETPPRVVVVHDPKRAHISPALPALFHVNHEARVESFKLRKENVMTIDCGEHEDLQRAFYFNYEKDMLLYNPRLRDGPQRYRYTESKECVDKTRIYAVGTVFLIEDLAKVQKLVWTHPIETKAIFGPVDFTYFKSLKEFVYFTPNHWNERNCALRPNQNGITGTLKRLFSFFASEIPGYRVPQVYALGSVMEFLDDFKEKQKISLG